MAVGRILAAFSQISSFEEFARAFAGQQISDAAHSAGQCVLPAAVAISRGQLVNVNSDGTLRLADKDAPRPADGIAISSGGIGKKVTYQLLNGYVERLSGLVAGTTYWTGNGGAMLAAAPGAGIKQSIGRAISATELLLSITYP